MRIEDTGVRFVGAAIGRPRHAKHRAAGCRPYGMQNSGRLPIAHTHIPPKRCSKDKTTFGGNTYSLFTIT
jgi:hypothetical protein